MNNRLSWDGYLPLAQREAWESLGNRFSGDHANLNAQDLWSLAGVVMAGIALVWMLRWLYRLQQARHLSCNPRHLFADLCRAHRISRGDRRRLQSLADYHQLASSMLLFVRPDLFDPAGLPDDEADEQSTAAYERLRQKLFSGIEDAKRAPKVEPAAPAVANHVLVTLPGLASVDAAQTDTRPVS